MGFLHRFQQGRLGLGAGPVDLIGEHDVGEHRAGSEDELPLGWPLPNRQASASRIAAVLPRRYRSTSASTASWGVTEARDDLLDLLRWASPAHVTHVTTGRRVLVWKTLPSWWAGFPLPLRSAAAKLVSHPESRPARACRQRGAARFRSCRTSKTKQPSGGNYYYEVITT